MGWSSGDGTNGDRWGTGDLRAGGQMDHIDLAAIPDGVTHLKLITGISGGPGRDSEPAFGWLEVHKDGEFALVAASAGLGVVLKDGRVWGCRPIPVPSHSGG